ncbi:hypothetical protein GWO43_02900, partial [candidate division KSB1 bacterium]|nr:hypothetical protein [candidate division KSB1 bacterium]NIT69856.1 hypothetical protein [candidate division KSB1 bacterium]NIU90479.1 hypothetical protein [candidate division KSB1 bacterium]NIW68518.1 hypothetical protein [candidate division KSB1 bacterium]NIX69537.1 hypothetical protein [candidate division KSB1 bacterium]
MNTENPAKTIHGIIADILTRMGIDDAKISESFDELTGTPCFLIETSHAKALIGHGGATLSSLNHIVKKITEHVLPDPSRFLIDVN